MIIYLYNPKTRKVDYTIIENYMYRGKVTSVRYPDYNIYDGEVRIGKSTRGCSQYTIYESTIYDNKNKITYYYDDKKIYIGNNIIYRIEYFGNEKTEIKPKYCKKKADSSLAYLLVGLLLLILVVFPNCIRNCNYECGISLTYNYLSNLDGYEVSAPSGYNCGKNCIIPIRYNNKSVVSIANEGFKNHTEIQELIIPENIIHIGENSFQGCSNINSVSLYFTGESKESNDPFYYLFGDSVDCVPSNLYQITYLGNNINNRAFESLNIKSVNIPNVITIGIGAFFDCKNLETITFGSGLTTLGHLCFSCCNISNIELPSSLKNIGYNIFVGNSNNLNIVLENNNYFCVENDFFMDKNKTIIYFYLKKAYESSLTIPDGIKYIKPYAFYDNLFTDIIFNDDLLELGECSIYSTVNNQNIYINNGIKKIYDYGKDKNLTYIKNIFYSGSISEWNNIEFNTDIMASLPNATITYDYHE